MRLWPGAWTPGPWPFDAQTVDMIEVPVTISARLGRLGPKSRTLRARLGSTAACDAGSAAAPSTLGRPKPSETIDLIKQIAPLLTHIFQVKQGYDPAMAKFDLEFLVEKLHETL